MKEREWLNRWFSRDESSWPLHSILEIDRQSELSWFIELYRQLYKQVGSSFKILNLDEKWDLRSLQNHQMTLFSDSLTSLVDHLIITPSRLLKKQEEELMTALMNTPGRWIIFSSPAFCSKLVQKHGLSSTETSAIASPNLFWISFSKEKPWDRKARWKEWLTRYSKKRNRILTDEAFELVWLSCSNNRLRMQNEVDKFIQEINDGELISKEIVDSLSFFNHSQQVWKWNELILSGHGEALTQIQDLLLLDASGISSVSILAKQWKEGLIWIGKGEVPAQARYLSVTRKKSLEAQWKALGSDFMMRSIEAIYHSLFTLKDGGDPLLELSRLVLVLRSQKL